MSISVEALPNVLRLALGYAPSAHHAALAALFALDSTLANIVRTTTQPLIGQMRFTWWHERLSALETQPAPAEPLLASLQSIVQHYDIAGADLAKLVEGWEVLLEAPPVTSSMLDVFSHSRGEALFMLAGRLIGNAPSPHMGRGWALSDLAAHWSDDESARQARNMAASHFSQGTMRGPRMLRFLARLAAHDVMHPGKPPSRWTILRAAL